ncbi:MAG TPA: GTPase domain-containing protein [Candidatus Obscuribacterales bacterium]
MPLPFVPIFIVAIVFGGVLGGSVVSNWENIVYSLQGKKIVVLGAREVGKTTLLKYMERGILIERYNQTLKKEQIERITLDDLKVRLKKTHDVSGDTAAYTEWKELFEEADLVLYIVRTDMLLRRDTKTEERIQADLQQIKRWSKKLGSKKQKQFFIVGNHWDSDPRFKNLTPDKIGNYLDEFRSLPVVENMTLLVGGESQVKVALGSLATEKDAHTLIQTIFTQVKK